MSTKKGNKSVLTLISARAKKLYDGGKGVEKKWTNAIKRASAELKKEGKI